ncbi:EpsG family protein [Kaistella sp. G5-32]|uniref:EpsG family protein n=1 Tax=Kaistella gelatinilytica TaxID=2787636 RepID=A0ABS0FC31_9FLAO|nr:EpsG family protein [Kaistella gelatinilytica]MBF8457251.1 EpsG family protein [Kaistella gelatinilytica]
MFDWIPAQSYTAIYYNVLLIIALLISFHALIFDVNDEQSINFFYSFGYAVVLTLILYMGLRPINNDYFGDTQNYARVYDLLQKGVDVKIKSDYLFNYLMKFSSNIMSINSFFLMVDVMYVIPCFLFSRKYFSRYWFFAMFMLISSFSFWSYGTNGLRNGLATSFFLMGLYFYDKKYWMYFWFGLGFFMHASLVIPIAAFIVSGIYKNPKVSIYIWFLAIPLSVVGGSSWSSLFATLGMEDRTSGYLNNVITAGDEASATGFRWDFLVYSGSAVFTGAYFIFKKKITDPFYVHVFGMYCIANAFWILVITAAYSNRFAYLSWFLMPVIFAYPMFRYKIWKEQYKIFGAILFVYFMFTYFMNVIK